MPSLRDRRSGMQGSVSPDQPRTSVPSPNLTMRPELTRGMSARQA